MAEVPCWEWPGRRRKEDGRAVAVNKRYAYREVYELAYGAIPAGHVLDHTCGNPGCVNPAHLQPMTQSEHIKLEIQRGKLGLGDANVGQARKVLCRNGHPYAGENLYTAPNGDRHCRICRTAAKKRYRTKKQGVIG